jgi:hypothetical protein
MTEDTGWRSKGEKVLRRSPRKTGKKCGRPFVAPRQVTHISKNRKQIPDPKDTEDNDVQVLTDSEVQKIGLDR